MDNQTATEYSNRSLRQLRDEAKANSAWAELILGRRYELAIGVRRDDAQALWHYRRAANMRLTKQWVRHRVLSDANYQAIVCAYLTTKCINLEKSRFDVLLSEDVVLENLDAAEQWWNTREASFEIEATIWSTRLLYATTTGRDIYAIIRKLASLCNFSRYSIAVLYGYASAVLRGCRGIKIIEETGRVLSSNSKSCDEWYEDKRKFHRDLSRTLSVAYSEGWGAKQDASASLYFLRRAAFLCDADAQKQLVDLYNYGKGVDVNPDIAKYWAYRADHKGLPLHNKLTPEVLNNMLVEEIAKVKSCGIALLEIDSHITIDSKTKAYGLCHCDSKSGKAIVSLSAKFIEGDEEDVRETIAHEVIHAAVDAQAHGKQWLSYVDRMMRHYGYPFPTARGDFKTADVVEREKCTPKLS